MIFQLLGRADVNGRGNHVVAGLTHIDVIVWVDNFARTDRFSGQLRATVGDHFVCVRVRARPRAGLKNVEREMFVQLALDYFFSGLDNERGAIGIEQSEIMIRLSGGPFDQPKGPNERAGKTIPADWKIEHGALRGSAVK